MYPKLAEEIELLNSNKLITSTISFRQRKNIIESTYNICQIGVGDFCIINCNKVIKQTVVKTNGRKWAGKNFTITIKVNIVAIKINVKRLYNEHIKFHLKMRPNKRFDN